MWRIGGGALAVTALAVAIAGSARAADGPGDAGRSWEAKNRQRARAGLLPRKAPPKPARAGTVEATRPTAVPPAGAVASATRPPATAFRVEGTAHAPGLLSRSWLVSGEQVHRVVDERGRISERRIDARGLVVEARVVGDAATLPVVAERRDPGGGVVQVRRDVSGALVALTRDGEGHLLGARVLSAAEAGAL